LAVAGFRARLEGVALFVGFLTVAFFFGARFVAPGFFSGIGMVMPGICWSCAATGDGIAASASALTVTGSIFTKLVSG
jgi:hypothetical protein